MCLTKITGLGGVWAGYGADRNANSKVQDCAGRMDEGERGTLWAGSVVSSRGEYYPAGLHRYAKKEDAWTSWLLLRWPPAASPRFVCRVYVRKVRTIGEEEGKKVYVADEMPVKREDVVAALKEAKVRPSVQIGERAK